MKKKIAIMLMCTALLSGCGIAHLQVGSKPETNYQDGVVPNIVEIGCPGSVVDGDVYYYTVDKNTGVVYLSYDGYRRHAITVMLNADGTPITAEQLGLPY